MAIALAHRTSHVVNSLIISLSLFPPCDWSNAVRNLLYREISQTNAHFAALNLFISKNRFKESYKISVNNEDFVLLPSSFNILTRAYLGETMKNLKNLN